MGKHLIFVAAPPACGKNYVSDMICKSVPGIVFLDKDELAPLMRRAFFLSNQEFNMDGSFYRDNLRPFEYETLLEIAFSNLRYSDTVLVCAPFGREVRDSAVMAALKARAAELGAALILVWVSTPVDICHARMKARNARRDRGKLLAWEAYASAIRYDPPQLLADSGAVDRLFIFDNRNLQTAEESLARLLKILKEGRS